jgi:hypothetical protein
MSRYKIWVVVGLAAIVASEMSLPLFAGRVGGGGGGVRAQSRSSISAGGNRGANVNRNQNFNRNTNVNQNINVNRNVNVNSNYYGGGYGGGCCYHPVATAAAVTATAVVTAAVVGSIVNSLPPSCSTVIVNGLAYQQCGSTWYQPQLSGSTTTYVVVNAPR